MNRNKQIIIMILSLVLSITASACTSSLREPKYSAEEEYISFDEAINSSYCIVSATLKEIIENDDFREYLFLLEKSLKGDMDVDHFYVTEGYGEIHVKEIDQNYSTVEPRFSVGGQYILLLSKTTSVYFDHDKYMCLGDSLIQIDNNNKFVKFQMYDKDIDIGIRDINELKAYIDKVSTLVKIVEAYGVPFTKSDKLSEIVTVSNYIVHVKIGSISIKAPNSNRDTYYCNVIKNFKGSTDEKIQVVLFKGTVTEGEEYILLLNKESGNSLLYTLSSRNSVISFNQTDQIKQLYELLENPLTE